MIMSYLIIERVNLTRQEVENIYNLKKSLDEIEMPDELNNRFRFIESPSESINIIGKPWYRQGEKRW